jgi:hypothetical protein
MNLLTELKNCFEKFSKIHYVFLVIFVLYFLFPFTFPEFFYKAVESIPGMIFLFILVVYLFLYVHPILGTFFVLALYEFFRRNHRSQKQNGPYSYVQYKPKYEPPKMNSFEHVDTPVYDNIEMPVTETVNLPTYQVPIPEVSLEEEIIQQMAPYGVSETGVYIDSTFRPVSNSLASSTSSF